MIKNNLGVQSRSEQGRSASRRLRRNGLVPAIIYGDGHAILISIDHNILYYALKRENFHSSIISLDVDNGKQEKVLLRDYQMHPFRQQVLHVDFQRINEKEEVQIRIPLHFVNEDICIAVKVQGAHITHIVSDVEIRALAKDIPQFIEVDLKNVKAGQTIHLSDLILPQGISLVNLLRGDDSAIAIAAGIAEETSLDTIVSAADIPTISGKKDSAE